MTTNIINIRKKYIPLQGKTHLKKYSIKVINKLLDTKYVYHFDWLGIPSIQFPSDLMVIQEIINKYRPEIIIETGVAHGGSLIFYASILHLIKIKDPKVIGIDIKNKKNNKKNILNNHLSKYIELIEKNSTDQSIYNFLKRKIKNKKVIIILDSNHSHNHVLEELKLYSKFIKKSGYLIVMDTTTEFVKKKHINKNRNFGKGNNPLTAVKLFLKKNNKFKIDKYFSNKSLITSCFDGFLKKIKN